MTKRITLKVVKRTEEEDSASMRDALLNLLSVGMNKGTAYPDLITELRAYLDTKTIRYRELLIERIQGSTPQPLEEAERRADLIDTVRALKDGDLWKLKDSEHTTLMAIMAEYKIQPVREIIRFHRDVERADDALPQITREAIAEEATERIEDVGEYIEEVRAKRNGRALHTVGAN